MAGKTTKRLDPYFPFVRAVGVWVQTFAGLGIHYEGAMVHSVISADNAESEVPVRAGQSLPAPTPGVRPGAPTSIPLIP